MCDGLIMMSLPVVMYIVAISLLYAECPSATLETKFSMYSGCYVKSASGHWISLKYYEIGQAINP